METVGLTFLFYTSFTLFFSLLRFSFLLFLFNSSSIALGQRLSGKMGKFTFISLALLSLQTLFVNAQVCTTPL